MGITNFSALNASTLQKLETIIQHPSQKGTNVIYAQKSYAQITKPTFLAVFAFVRIVISQQFTWND